LHADPAEDISPMRRAFLHWLVLPFLGFAWADPGRPAAAAEGDGPPGASFGRDIVPVLKKYCTSCHGGKEPKGGFGLEFEEGRGILGGGSPDRDLWERVADNVRSGLMPPGKRPKPTPSEAARLITWVERDLLATDCTVRRDPGRVTLRRLNKAEYTSTIRDLLFIDGFKAAEDFPADDVGYGFDNNGDVLSLSPVLLERYLDAAEQAVTLAFKDAGARRRLLEPARGLKESFYNKQERAKLILEAFVPRAYRRPASAEEVARLLRFVQMSLAQDGESADRAAFLAMRAALVSPHFLFRVELDREDTGAGVAAPLGEFELASRLSYFLWSSMPDDELFGRAREKTLRDDLEGQVRRMLKDPRARALTDNFAGQWLELRGLRQVSPDPALFPAFDERLRGAMLEESERFFEAIVREDQSILDLIDADFTFVNQRLAEHYGIPGVVGEEFRRVPLDPRRRGGILTHASILTLTSTPTRTSPVKRGVWILENILNTPPPPPPPDVPALEADGKQLRGSLRQVMMQHRADLQCAVCHDRIDPLGLAFENYDAIGSWRDRDGGVEIDPSGTLPDGRGFGGPEQLRLLLKERAGDFRRCLAEKLLTYALGRGLNAYDRCAVDEICAATARDDRFSALVLAVARSQPFQYRKGKGGEE
jgi:Protein of unknown function (DUF1592)/Protein of unknown function (DUF1588)/Protein of unknown function (DUF1587)/Protein of unknown function (DUF1585)/Protein of unknown function (DUF1595)/Planctomycete cytochrome C